MKNYYLISGIGQGSSNAVARNKVLEINSIAHCRSLMHVSYLSKDAILLEKSQVSNSNTVTDVFLAFSEGVKGSRISAGIILADLYKNGKKDKTLFLKQEGQISEEEIRGLLNSDLEEIFKEYDKSLYELKNITLEVKTLKVEENHGTVAVGLGFVDKFMPMPDRSPGAEPFLAKESTYEDAKFIIMPVLYEHPVKVRDTYAPLEILKASRLLEDYDLETDQQLSKYGVHTHEPLVSVDLPNVFVHDVEDVMAKFLRDGKFAVFLGEDQTLSIGVMKAIKENVGSFSVLHLGASTQLRSSFDGSSFSQACAIKKGLEYASDVVQVGIRATSNREKKDLQYDKIFFASDILDEKDDYWMEDVISELSMDKIYITIDANVFDPSVMMSKKPEPMGLSYSKVVKLIKLLARKKKILAIDFVGLKSIPEKIFSEFAAARLIYQTLCFLTKN
jgi:agmatinase